MDIHDQASAASLLEVSGLAISTAGSGMDLADPTSAAFGVEVELLAPASCHAGMDGLGSCGGVTSPVGVPTAGEPYEPAP